MPSLLPFSLVFLLSLSQFLSDRINIERSVLREYASSFAAAIAVTYLLLSFLPEAYSKSSGLILFIPLITGFLLIHLLEKTFYKKFSGRFSLQNRKTFHDELHAAILFVYHFVIGAVLIGLLDKSLVSGLLFLPPLLMFTTIGNWSLHHAYLKNVPYTRLLLASSTMLGALFAKSDFITPNIERVLVNFAAGILLFIIIRESLPKEKEGRPEMFVLGIILYGALLFLLNQLAY